MAEYVGYDELPPRRFQAFPRRGAVLAAILLLLGSAAFVAALVTDPARAWRAYLQNWLFFSSISCGAVLLAGVVTMARGLWSQPIRRIALSFVAFLPLAWLLLIPLVLVSGSYYFPWTHGPLPPGKRVWLNVPFVIGRNLSLFGAFVGVALAFAYWSLRPDLGLLRERAGREAEPGVWARFLGGWRGAARERVRASHNTAILAPILALLFALDLTLVAFDFVMALDPRWHSSLIGGYYFAGALLGGIAATALVAIAYRQVLGLQNAILPGTFHDLGKLHFAFNILWAYLFWSQFLVVWYGLIPNEQGFVNQRFASPNGIMALVVLFCLFVIPAFGMLGVLPKRTPAIQGIFNVVVLIGLWIERWLLTYPSWYPRTRLWIGWPEVGTGFAFAGLLLASLLWFARRFPVLQLWRPEAELELLPHGRVAPGEGVTLPD